MTTQLRSLMIVITLVIGVSACQSATTKWQHATIPQDYWSTDAAQCRHEALREAEKRLTESNALRDESADQDLTVNQMMAQDKVSDRAKVYFKSCMSTLGYTPVQR